MENVDESGRIALIVVDVQNDFCDGGSLAVSGSLGAIESINTLLQMERNGTIPWRFHTIVYSSDWHPPKHVSFASRYQQHEPFDTIELHDGKVQQKLWPDHCIQDSFGAELHENLDTERIDLLIKKGTESEADAYSAFHGTVLAQELNSRKIQNVVIVGIATDVCVKATAIDAVHHQFATTVLTDCCAAVDKLNEAFVFQEMESVGINVTTLSSWIQSK